MPTIRGATCHVTTRQPSGRPLALTSARRVPLHKWMFVQYNARCGGVAVCPRAPGRVLPFARHRPELAQTQDRHCGPKPDGEHFDHRENECRESKPAIRTLPNRTDCQPERQRAGNDCQALTEPTHRMASAKQFSYSGDVTHFGHSNNGYVGQPQHERDQGNRQRPFPGGTESVGEATASNPGQKRNVVAEPTQR
jgi:hypothetical protein